MKYIKLFNESSSEEYYDRIDQDEFMRLFHNQTVDMSKNSVERLSKSFNKSAGMIIHKATEETKLLEDEKKLLKAGMGTSRRIKTWDLKLKYLGKEKGSVEMINIMFTDLYLVDDWEKFISKVQIQIWEIEDEWFIVDVSLLRLQHQVFFKCDQTDGVWELLKDLMKDEQNDFHWFIDRTT
jgi:hypothetical protein